MTIILKGYVARDKNRDKSATEDIKDGVLYFHYKKPVKDLEQGFWWSDTREIPITESGKNPFNDFNINWEDKKPIKCKITIDIDL